MLLNIFNCSPRGERSNSAILTRAFAKGFCDTEEFPGNQFQEFFLARQEDFEKAREAFPQKSTALVAFPIYVDAMPGLAKNFFETLRSYKGACGSTRMIFLIQTGFPEETHTRPMQAYLPKLARRLGTLCPGVIRMGSGEGIRRQGKKHRGRKLLNRYEQMGRSYARTGILDEKILAGLTGPTRHSPLLMRFVLPLVNHFFWNRELKKNGAYSKRFDRPLD